MTEHPKTPAAGWQFDNSYAKLPDSFYTHVRPTHVPSPKFAIFNDALADSLGLNIEHLQSETGINELAGNQLPPGAMPLAQAYAGHQFGHFTMLGDGRAILLGEHLTPTDERFDIQLKGAGPTPYSRGGDGRAALGPMLREYVISEAMHGLGIPTTRSLAVATTGESILRETELPGAILTRVAASHLRVGTFQFVANWGSTEDLQQLADYTLQRHFPDVTGENRSFALLEAVISRQASLIAKWQLVGFVHGVMNTDNMTISGETIDYGPCAFMDTYDPKTVFSSIDYQGRYAYGNQPQIAGWNLARFAETLLPLLHTEPAKAIEIAQEALTQFGKLYNQHWLQGMRAKLGISNEETDDLSLINELLNLMKTHQADYTNTFLALTFDKRDPSPLFDSSEFKQWETRWRARIAKQTDAATIATQFMHDHNPAIIPRNHRVEEALDAAVEQGDYTVLQRFLDVLKNPYAHTSDQKNYQTVPASSCAYQTFCGT